MDARFLVYCAALHIIILKEQVDSWHGARNRTPLQITRTRSVAAYGSIHWGYGGGGVKRGRFEAHVHVLVIGPQCSRNSNC